MKLFLKRWLVALALLAHLPCFAEDIDLFVGASSSTTDVPNVLIILDNTANWNTAFTNEKAALVSVFNGLTANKFRVGLMMFTETGGGNSGNDGAYVRAAIRLMDTSTKAKYASMINALDQTGDKSNGGKIGKSMWEAYQYLSGSAPHAGNNKNKTDYVSNTAGNAYDDAVHALSGNALAAKTSTTYVSPIASGCAKNYIIYISNGAAQDNTSDTTASRTALGSAGGVTTTISLSPSGSQDNVADEWARFMKASDLNVTVYTVDINKVTTGQGPGWTALLKSMAGQTSGKYFDIAGTTTVIQDTLNGIFSEIQAVNSVFASVSLPVSVNTQGNYLNQVYVGMFRPDQNAAPRWNGNLKQYKLGMTSGALRLQDADSAAAINNQTGFITECARSYWTPTTVDTEWASREQGDCITVSGSAASNYPDGNIVEKGAQAYKLRSTSTRTTFTCNSTITSCTSLTSFNSTNVTQSLLGASSTSERDTLLNWALGQDTDDEDIDEVTTAERRLSAHGDVVHSRPVAINFGASDATADVVVFYGGNDGWFRAVNGNRSNAIGTVPAGGELWSFMPPEFYTNVKRLRDNTTEITTPTNSVGTAAKPYGMDGPITAFKGTLGGSSKAVVYASMRRGGRAIHAFDVTNSITAPTSPSLKWKIGCSADGATCTTGMSGMGQSWSSVRNFTTSSVGSGATPLLIFGGGYDACEDTDSGTANHSCTSSSKGHYIYVRDADTGAEVTTFDTGGTRGVIGDMAFVKDSTGQVVYAYAADLGGDVYRLNFASTGTSTWTITKIASLGCADTSTCAAPRKFMFAPSVVANTDGSYTVLLGSGDREKPLTTYVASAGVANYFFAFTDKPTVPAATFPGSGDCGSNVICLSSLLPITTSSTPTTTALAAKKGWYLGLSSTEQVVTSAITIAGVTTFSTHAPATTTPGSCSANLGTTRVYNISFLNAASANGTSSRYEDVAGDGLPPSPVAGRVTLDDGTQVPFCIGCSKDSPLEGEEKGGSGTVVQPKARLYWYIQK